ncbi:MAG: Oxidoreductase family, NAD-binding Rossmann fold protein [Parcubacteria group bacterium GW2011_GWA2_43_17]|nr:MAG: Oxidoreductase family, NAD-binding Rossmann fold protein [Parcubacteria group bacterium GW2011_GWA2_43_17]OHB42129.1 MAG: hypothetical protein A2Y13_07440 [Planctomycetes bacterium GWC2_45_44]
MINVGIVGCGMIGQVHFASYNSLKNVRCVAVCDNNPAKFEKFGKIQGNIELKSNNSNIAQVRQYTNFEDMLKNEKLDVISIAVPTHLHADFSIRSLEAGVNVLCEKPMALTSKECKQMISAAKSSGKHLQVGHCIRFWPEYVETKAIIDSGEYGRVLAANFRRLSQTPTWSEDNWLLEHKKSGGAVLDLHIHDSDFVRFVFGMPKAVYSYGIKGPSGGYDHILTRYIYPGNDTAITAEGGWMMTPSFGFEMSFHVVLEHASIVYNSTRAPTLIVCPSKNKMFPPKLADSHGYLLEIEHFLKIISGKCVKEIITPKQSWDSVRIIDSERHSARLGKPVTL